MMYLKNSAVFPLLLGALLCTSGSLADPTTVRPAISPAQSPAAQITGAALLGGGAYAYAADLSDRVGARLAGSSGADRAVEWALRAMRDAGLKNVHKEPVRVPRWVRGEESAEILTPAAQVLKLAALGNSIGTPPDGVEGEVLEATSLEDLRGLGERVQGKILLFNQPMKRTSDFSGYGAAVPLRHRGAVFAARAGAIAMLVRSIGTDSHRLPHTGGSRYEDGVPAIPAAALAIADAELLHRLLQTGERVRVRLRLSAHKEGEVESANVVGELPGRELPREIVLIGAHLDSWDLGTGALDDAAGCGIVLDTAHTLFSLALRPRRTVRVVLFMNEELGLSGAYAYAAAHKAELPAHAAALEADSGAGMPLGYHLAGDERGRALVQKWVQPLSRLLPDKVNLANEIGADISPLQDAGVAVLTVAQDVSEYFDWHHTAGDTLDKINPHELALVTAAFASLTFAAADSPERLPPSSPTPHH
jgi:hypothetical protein